MAQLNKAKAEVKRKRWSLIWTKFWCNHNFKQTHPPLVPNDWPKGKPIGTHCQLTKEGYEGNIATFVCIICDKEKWVPLEALKKLEIE